MKDEPRILVLIPAYNEAENIVDTVRAVRSFGYDYVVINDGSTDGTLRVCRENKINVVDLPQNLGIGGAIQTGHEYAQRYGYDIDVQVDGDGQHDPRYISLLVEKIKAGNDLVIGSRFLEDSDGFKSTFMRRVGKTWLSMCLMILTGHRITDPTSGFRACNRDAIDLFSNSYPVDYPEPESIATALRHGLVVDEAPVIMRERQGGESSIGLFASAYYMVKVTLAIVISCMAK